jgi:F-type H+-transporting ATPase subunit delta
MSLAAANRYARALSDLVLAPSSGVPPQDALDRLREFHQTLEASPELRLALMSPAVAASSKRAAVGKLADRLELPRLLRNFLFVIVDHRRIPLTGRIVEAFEKALDDRLGRVRATITSAAPLNEAQQRNIESRLAAQTGRQVRSEFRIDPALIGGVAAQIGSTVYDGSVRGRLQALRARMASE